jgi:hypothetical protein
MIVWFLSIILSLLKYWGLNSGPTPWATLPALFCEGLFQNRVSNYLPGISLTVTVLISASWVAGITGMSLWPPACPSFSWCHMLCLLIHVCWIIFVSLESVLLDHSVYFFMYCWIWFVNILLKFLHGRSLGILVYSFLVWLWYQCNGRLEWVWKGSFFVIIWEYIKSN